MNEQTWLSLDGICNVLQTDRYHINWLVKNGYLEMIPANPGRNGARYLDPTPTYADRLRVSEMIYERRHPLPADMDLSGKAIFTRAEVGAILGWSDSYAHRYLTDNKIPSVKIGKLKNGGLRLYTAQTIRGLLWRRDGYKVSSQKAPYLVEHLIQWFLEQDAEERKGVPDDKQVLQDSLLQKNIKRILKLPPVMREQAMRELWDRVEIARRAAALLRTPGDTARPSAQ